MGFVLTGNARIVCDHGGQVTVIPRQLKVLIQGSPVLCEGDLVEAPIVGCPQAGPGIKPCTTVLPSPPAPGLVSLTMFVGGRAVHLDGFIAPTDGAPPATVAVVFAGQELVQA